MKIVAAFKRWVADEGSVAKLTIAFFLFSCLVHVLSVLLGVASGESGPAGGYLTMDKPNWLLFPLFWLPIAALVYVSWHLFMTAWQSLCVSGVIQGGGGAAVPPATLSPFLAALNRGRVVILGIGVALGLIFTAVDAECLWSDYGILPGSPCGELDFSVAWRLESDYPGVGKTANGVFVLLVYLMQGALICMAFVALLQVLVHTCAFLWFERTATAGAANLKLTLSWNDPNNDFGLSRWNRAIDWTYAFLAGGMLIPVLSHYTQGDDPRDIGQTLLQSLVPLILFAPVVLPFLTRYAKLPGVWPMAFPGGALTRATKAALIAQTFFPWSIQITMKLSSNVANLFGSVNWKTYAAQRMWPLQKDYLGIIFAAVCAFEYVYLIDNAPQIYRDAFGWLSGALG